MYVYEGIPSIVFCNCKLKLVTVTSHVLTSAWPCMDIGHHASSHQRLVIDDLVVAGGLMLLSYRSPRTAARTSQWLQTAVAPVPDHSFPIPQRPLHNCEIAPFGALSKGFHLACMAGGVGMCSPSCRMRGRGDPGLVGALLLTVVFLLVNFVIWIYYFIHYIYCISFN
jgi:hypothetical protein